MSCTPTIHEKLTKIRAFDIDKDTYQTLNMYSRCECFVLDDYRIARELRAKKLKEGAK